LAIETPWDALNVGMGVASFLGNVAVGNVGGAILDAVGIVVDSAATVVPGVPGGAGTAIKLLRGADRAADLVRAGERANKALKAADKGADALKAGETLKAGRTVGQKTAKETVDDAARAAERNTGPTNKREGLRRERESKVDLQNRYPDASIQNEQYLRNVDGTIAKDPMTEKGRRIDHVVIKDGTAMDSVETTSRTSNKRAMTAKEGRIREAGGTYVKDRESGKLVDFKEVPTRLDRRD